MIDGSRLIQTVAASMGNSRSLTCPWNNDRMMMMMKSADRSGQRKPMSVTIEFTVYMVQKPGQLATA